MSADFQRPSSAVDSLEHDGEYWFGEGESLSRQIERAEGELYRMRERRADAFRLAAECKAAANVLRELGLRSSLMDGKPFIEFDYVPKRPVEGLAESRGTE